MRVNVDGIWYIISKADKVAELCSNDESDYIEDDELDDSDDFDFEDFDCDDCDCACGCDVEEATAETEEPKAE